MSWVDLTIEWCEDTMVFRVRDSRPEVFLGKGILRICCKFVGEHPCRSAISIKLRSNWTAASVRVFIFFFFFCLEPTVRKYNLDQNDFCHWYGNFLKVLSWKLLDRSYVGSFLSTITRHIGNSILKDTLQSKILPTWISIPVNSFIKNWEDIWKENRSCLKSYTLHTNASLHFEQHCTKIDHILLIFTRFFSLKQT